MFLELYAIENDKCKVIYNLIDKNVIQRLAVSNNAIKGNSQFVWSDGLIDKKDMIGH